MALRVLLGDESSTIKKVFQLALQDFAVEVRPVNVGVDVVPVALNFKPDIIFADVLLQKKSGYDVCAEIKQHSTLKSVPVVLMWSGFMELDEDKFQACMANAQLEKPFDVAQLRKLVTDLVPRTQSSRLSQFLSFPPLPEIEEPAGMVNSQAGEEFHQIPIPQMKSTGKPEKFRLNLTPEELEANHVPVDYDLPSENIRVDDVVKAGAPAQDEPVEEFSFRDTKPSKPSKPSVSPPAIPDMEMEDMVEDDEPIEPQTLMRTQTTPQFSIPQALTEAQLEKIIREQSAEMIESVVWKVVPELAAQIIERELQKLLKERDSHL